MEIVFDKQYLEELYLTGKTSDKKHRYQPHIIAKYRKTIDLLESVGRVEDLYRYHSLNYEVLVVYMADHSMRQNYRLHEMLNGLWNSGVTTYPVFGIFNDFSSQVV